MNKIINGFTLAEVLLTLAVIGIVAAMSVPALIANTQKQEYATTLEKFYGTFTQALQRYAANKGCVNDLACTGLFKHRSATENPTNTPDRTLAMRELTSALFNNIKECEIGQKGCWGDNVKFANGWLWDGAWDFNNNGTRVMFIVADGISIEMGSKYGAYNDNNAKCESTDSIGSGATPKGNINDGCTDMSVDVNGPKPPNIVGRDIFFFIVRKNGSLYPFGGHDLPNTTNTTWWDDKNFSCTNYIGMNCAARIIEKGWKMDY